MPGPTVESQLNKATGATAKPDDTLSVAISVNEYFQDLILKQ